MRYYFNKQMTEVLKIIQSRKISTYSMNKGFLASLGTDFGWVRAELESAWESGDGGLKCSLSYIEHGHTV